jgi:hypothetical protein
MILEKIGKSIIRTKTLNIKSVSIFLLSTIFISLALNIFKDYGVSWDEPISRTNGMVTLNYLAETFWPSILPDVKQYAAFKIPLDQYSDRDYGVAFELPLSLIERLLQLDDTRSIYLMRHLMTFIVSCGGLIAIYSMAKRRFSDWRIGLIAVIFLVLSPRQFAESFYNDKDIIFMAIFAMSLDSTISCILKPRFGTSIKAGIITAIAIDIRIMAIILPLILLTVLAVRSIRREIAYRNTLIQISIYILTVSAFVIAFWPWLWMSPISNFVQAFENMAKFRWNLSILYMGSTILATQIPWHYIPIWIAISTPLLYVVLFMFGCASILRNIYSRRIYIWKSNQELQDVIFLATFMGPIIAVVILGSVLYDGWRQMYFLYPSFLLVATIGYMRIWYIVLNSKKQSLKALLIAATVIALSNTMIWMVKAHPYQNNYFNVLAGTNWKRNFDVDYWGLSNRQALEYILTNDKNSKIKVWPGSATALPNGLLLINSNDRVRIIIVDKEEQADYIITNYRSNSIDYSVQNNVFDLYKSFIVDNEIILSVFKRI